MTVEEPVLAWGHNGYGQLGDGTKQSRDRPVQVAGVEGAKTIAAGGYHSVATGWPSAAAGPAEADAEKAGHDKKSVKELRDELRDRDLKVSGNKDELVARLEAYDSGANVAFVEAQGEKAADGEKAVEELPDERRDCDSNVSGGKQEVMARLEEEGSVRGETDVGDDDVAVGSGQRRRPLREVVARIRDDFTAIAGLEAERVSELRPTEDGWRAKVDVVELSRVPASTDVLATYEVSANVEGSVAAFERVRRFRRSDAGDR